MKIIKERDLIRNVADAWAKQYKDEVGDKAEIKKKLIALNKEVATSEEVEKIIGNNSWTRIRCDECNKYVTLVVRVGEEPDYESHTATLCRECLTAACYLLEGVC